MTKRHSPLRSCIVCGNKISKKNLVRIASTSEGVVEIDSNGRIPGRGAYVCTDRKCGVQGLTIKHLEHALRTTFKKDNFQKLRDAIEYLNNSNLIMSPRSDGC